MNSYLGEEGRVSEREVTEFGAAAVAAATHTASLLQPKGSASLSRSRASHSALVPAVARPVILPQ